MRKRLRKKMVKKAGLPFYKGYVPPWYDLEDDMYGVISKVVKVPSGLIDRMWSLPDASPQT